MNAQTIVKGDMNDDKELTITDAVSVVDVVLGKSPKREISLVGDPYLVDNTLVIGTWYAPDGTLFTLNEDGTGTMTMDDDSAGITSWVVNGDTITITVDDGSSASGKFLGDVIELDILGGGNMIIYYATADADISGYDLMTMEELQEAYKNKGN